MPIAKLEFKLPEEKREFDLACAVGAVISALHSHAEVMRAMEKHNDYKDNPPADPSEIVNLCRSSLYDALEVSGVGWVLE